MMPSGRKQWYTPLSPRITPWLSFLAGVLALVPACYADTRELNRSNASVASQRAGDVSDLVIVDCLVADRLVKTPARDCLDQGGQFTARGDRDAALRVWLPRAQQGDKAAQNYVGEIYEKGLNSKPDYARAAEWYRRAADHGYARAQANLALLYEKGLGVARDPVVALMWYRKAAVTRETTTAGLPPLAEVERLTNRVADQKRQLEVIKQEVQALEKELGRLE